MGYQLKSKTSNTYHLEQFKNNLTAKKSQANMNLQKRILINLYRSSRSWQNTNTELTTNSKQLTTLHMSQR
jgi:hypothetical protein